ncbi:MULTISPECIES: hypothetical protein [Polyangium]|uniref:Uncharacterized protein n=1 Tax=Polyangium sorediatum TaxID=889274 RepID=A0ABT6P3F9_9BACT|nr:MULTISPECIES: hypothetical protein [Polyangium]MDI1435147.1 hypothetical protein [Polyangium sorediatum]
MSAFGTPRELALVAFLVGLVVIHSVVPRIGEAIGGLFERKKGSGKASRSEGAG